MHNLAFRGLRLPRLGAMRGVGGGGGGFDWTIGGAASLARLHLADDLSGMDGAAVTSWPDTSGNGLSAYANATGSLRPTLGTKGGRRFVTSGPSAGAGAYLVADASDTTLVSPTVATRVFVLARHNAISFNRDVLFGSTFDGSQRVEIYQNDLIFAGSIIIDGNNQAVWGGTLQGSAALPKKFMVFEAYLNQTASSYIDMYNDDGSRHELIEATAPLHPDGDATLKGEYLFAVTASGSKNISIAALAVYDVSSGDMTSAAKLAIRAELLSMAAEMEA
jgi:hypothetical protein